MKNKALTAVTVSVSKLDDNPFRKLDINPLDPNRTKSLEASIERNNLWRGIVARRVGDRYEIAFGHHRLQAIRNLKIKTIDIDVAELSDAQMLQHLSDENINQGGKNPRAIIEVVTQSIYMLEGYLAVSKTPEEFCTLANIQPATGGGPAVYRSATEWTKAKTAGTNGRDILRAFLTIEENGGGSWSNPDIQLGINQVKTTREYEAAKERKEAAQKEFTEKVGEVSDEEMDEIHEELTESTTEEKEAERFEGYNDIVLMFDHITTGGVYVNELKKHYPEMVKSEQIKFASKIIKAGTGKRDIPNTLGQMVMDQKAWAKEEKKRQAAKKRQANQRKNAWQERWKKVHSITPDQYVAENLGLFTQMRDVLNTLQPAFDHIEQDEVKHEFLKACQEIHALTGAYVAGLPEFGIKDVN